MWWSGVSPCSEFSTGIFYAWSWLNERGFKGCLMGNPPSNARIARTSVHIHNPKGFISKVYPSESNNSACHTEGNRDRGVYGDFWLLATLFREQFWCSEKRKLPKKKRGEEKKRRKFGKGGVGNMSCWIKSIENIDSSLSVSYCVGNTTVRLGDEADNAETRPAQDNWSWISNSHSQFKKGRAYPFWTSSIGRLSKMFWC